MLDESLPATLVRMGEFFRRERSAPGGNFEAVHEYISCVAVKTEKGEERSHKGAETSSESDIIRARIITRNLIGFVHETCMRFV